MATDSHAPNPRGLLCSAGAGAAAGNCIFFSLRFFFPLFLLSIEMVIKRIAGVYLGVNFVGYETGDLVVARDSYLFVE